MLYRLSGWLAVGAVGVLALHRLAFVAHVLFPVGGVLGLALVALGALLGTPEVAVLPIGLPNLPFHLRLDSLAAFFLMVIGAASAGVSAFAAGYFRKGEGTPPGLLCLEYHVFLASMVGVVLPDDAYAFMVMWETMALSSFFLVTANHRLPRSAGRLPVPAGRARRRDRHPAVLRRAPGQHRRLHLRQHARPAADAVLGLGGVPARRVRLRRQGRRRAAARLAARGAPGGAVAGVGADERGDAQDRRLRPAARHLRPAAGAALVVGRGAARARPGSALFGVVFAAVQVDMKRLLAYSSIENIGLVVAGIGLAVCSRPTAWSRWPRWR